MGDFIEYSESPLFSVMIGANGVGKSVLLSEVADFLIDLHLYQENKHDQISNYKGHIRALCYHIDGQKCFVARTPKAYVAKIGQYLSPIKNLIVPAVVASHFGAFDKFHNQSVNNVKRTKYDEDKYKYVGAHINGNITSASSISFRLLFALITAANNKQITNIIDILKFIKYDSLISLHYSKIRIRKDFKEHLKRYVFNDKDYEKSTNEYKTKIITNLCNIYNSIKNNDRFIINLHDEKSIYSNKDILQYLYKLKQYNLIKDTKVTFFKNGKEIMPEGMSSGEFMVLSTILSISLAVNHSHTIVLLDEPEISLHPNWQMSFIEIIDEALKFKNCHLLIATHSHMIVSDLPMKRSKVVQLKLDKEGNIQSQFIEGSTYGWSAEEVLLKVFNTATDRNRYLTECISILLEKMGNNEISCEDVSNELEHLKEVSKHLSKIDPLKEVLETIFKVYKY